MRKRSTALGFLPGEVDVGTHCMFVFPKRDEVYFDRVSGYLRAGLDAGEMCVCVCPPTCESILDHLRALGADSDSALATGQLVICRSADVYPSDDSFDQLRMMSFWDDRIEAARKHWNGIRIFGDADLTLSDRTVKLKMLEYEAKVNLAAPLVTMALCGYQSTSVPRSLLLQMKNVHPFVANVRSMQRNHRYVEPNRFFGTFYRFRRVSKTYPACSRNGLECQRHFEEIAAHTPMTTREIADMNAALGEAFANALEHDCTGLPAHRCHIHVCFMPQPTGFAVEIRDHGPGSGVPLDDGEIPSGYCDCEGLSRMRSLVHDLYIDRRNGDTVITMHTAYSLPFQNPSARPLSPSAI